MSWIEDKEQYQKLAHDIEPSVILTTKDAFFWKVLAVLVTIVTMGGIGYRQFLEEYATTIGPIQAYPTTWMYLSEAILIHEAVHTRQVKRLGFGNAWLGLPLFALLYLFLPLPLGFAWFRWRYEIEADEAVYAWMCRRGYLPKQIESRARDFGERVCGGNYGWSWIIRGEEGFVKAAKKAVENAEKADDVEEVPSR